MRALAFAILLAVVVLVILAVIMWLRAHRKQRALRLARWEAKYITSGETTSIICRRIAFLPEGSRVLEELPIDSFEISDPDWENRFHVAMSEARHRATALNSEG